MTFYRMPQLVRLIRIPWCSLDIWILCKTSNTKQFWLPVHNVYIGHSYFPESKISWYRKTTFDSIVSRTPGVPSRVRYQKRTKLHGFPQLFSHIFLLMSRKNVIVANFLDNPMINQWEALSHGWMVVISFHFLLQRSEFYWPFGLFFW